MKILAVESSCDETAVAIVEDGRKILRSLPESILRPSMRLLTVRWMPPM